MSFFLLLILFGSIKDICEGCETGYFSDNNQCQRCPSNCTSCSSAFSCTSCSVGYYGTLCSYACSNYCHENECDKSSGICLSCIKGYYRDENKTCVQCPKNCATCNSHNFCFACKSGYTGTVCEDDCRNCKPFTNCDKNSGYCFDSCSEGFSGELCDMECNSTCKSCERLNSHECTSCADGATGSPCREECFYRCLKNTCSGNDVACKYGCSSGYWGGEKCNQTCLTYCKNSFCNITCNETVASKLSSSSTTEASTVLVVKVVIGSIVIIVLFITVWIIHVVRKYRSKHGNCCYGSADKIYPPHSTSQPNETINDGAAMPLLNVPSQTTQSLTCAPTKQTASLPHTQEQDNSKEQEVQPPEHKNYTSNTFTTQDNEANLNTTETIGNDCEECEEATEDTVFEEQNNILEQSKEELAERTQSCDQEQKLGDNTQANKGTSKPIANSVLPAVQIPTPKHVGTSKHVADTVLASKVADKQQYRNMSHSLGDPGIQGSSSTSTQKENHEAMSSDKLVSGGAKSQDMNEEDNSKPAKEEASDENDDNIPGRSDVCTVHDNDPNEMVAQQKDVSSPRRCRIS